jgi:hypothetical protein
MLWLFGGLTLVALFTEFRGKADYRTLRDNYRNGNMGKFTEADFV